MPRWTWLLAGTVLSCLAGAARAAGDEQQPIVVTAPGGGTDTDDALTLSGSEIERGGTPNLLGALTRTIAGVTLQDAQGNAWQPNLVYRGFIASPLQGQSQGLAAYLDGARFNQPFGDTLQLDLVPDAAIRQVSIMDASPVYGLNALGGAVVIETKTGRSDPGVAVSLSGGRFDYREGAATAGFASGPWSGYIALQATHDDGWRDFSPSKLYNGYADIGYDAAGGGLHLKLIGARTNLTGNGVAPVELLAADRRAVFTFPDNSRTRYQRASLHPWMSVSATTRIEASLYAQRLSQRSVNGDAADIAACQDPPDAGLLCLSGVDDDLPPSVLTDAHGNAFADTVAGGTYGVLNRGRTRSRSGGALVQLIDKRALPGGENQLAIGFSYDRSRTRFAASTELGALNDKRGVDPSGGQIVQTDGAIAPAEVIARTGNWGLFLSDTLPVTGRLSAEIGLRWNHARIALADQIGTALNGRHRFQRLNPGIEFDYDLSKALSLRAGYSESNRTPTPAELSCADENAPCSLANFFIADPPLRQVVARTWEAGASGAAEAAGFRIHWLVSFYRATNHDDIQLIASGIRGRAFFQNIGNTRRQGGEANVTLKRGGLSASLSYALTDARFRSPVILGSAANPEADQDGNIAVSRGDRLPGIPLHSATFALDYAGRGFSLGGDIALRSGQYLVGDEANLTPKIHGYAVVNLRGSVFIMHGLTFFAELRNALNSRYETFGTFSEVDAVALEEAPGASDPRAYGPGTPRRWLAGVRANF